MSPPHYTLYGPRTPVVAIRVSCSFHIDVLLIMLSLLRALLLSYYFAVAWYLLVCLRRDTLLISQVDAMFAVYCGIEPYDRTELGQQAGCPAALHADSTLPRMRMMLASPAVWMMPFPLAADLQPCER